MVGVKIGEKIYDLSTPLDEDVVLSFVSTASPEGLEILRHSTAHVLAQAVKELYPHAQLAIGPVIENGFYYDVCHDVPFQPKDLEAITARMKEIVDRDLPVHRHCWTKAAALDFFGTHHERFKKELIEAFPEEETISVYTQGDFTDLCRGPHVPSTKHVGNGFALTKVSGAYWRGDQKNVQLQRIYGTAWPSEEALTAYLHQQAEAEKRDHRKIGKDMELFHFQPEAPGNVFWHPQGWAIYQLLQSYIQEKLRGHYHEINTPQVISCSLWQKSGHWDVFRKNMVTITHNDALYALKPMSCPCHIQIFNQGIKSYRDLPLRYAEFGRVTREEPSGALAGLMRLRAFVQDDGHIFCTPEQLVQEAKTFCETLFHIYHELGFTDILVRFSTRPDERIGSDELWDYAESSLKAGADAAGLSCVHFPKEGAFYGPKLEFVLKDSMGRLWQCGTLQADFMMPERLNAHYVDKDGTERPCVMLHRAILGSMERFIGVLLEHTGGWLPLWLAPTQLAVVTITEKVLEYGKKVANVFREGDIRMIEDFRQEKLGYKIREHTQKKVPYIAIIGAKEAENGTITLRWATGEDHSFPLEEALFRITHHSKSRNPSAFFSINDTPL